MARPREDRTYRVRQLQVPPDTTEDTLRSVLASLSDRLGPPENIQIYSVASDLSAYGALQISVATIAFSKTPSIFDDGSQWSLSATHLGWRRNVIFDTHFLGFTVLNEPDPRYHALDCIAISGLASHPFGSWKSRESSSNFMWLRDSLPHDLPSIRTILYGYDTTLSGSESFQTIQDLAVSFVALLATARPAVLSTKPMLFVAHSLGGIILKHALLEMANSEPRRYIFDSVRAVMFFGVPHKGMEIKHLRAMVGDQPNGTLVSDLGSESSYLRILDDQFSGLALQSVRIFSIFETKRSHTVQMADTGHWQRNGPPIIAVSRESATQRHSNPPDTLPIDRDHSNLVKFAEGDSDYDRVLGYLRDLFSSAEQSASILQSAKHNLSVGVVENLQALRSEMLGSLRSEDMDSRLSNIASPYESTFEWIWTAADLHFIPWLRTGTGTYWISGKPGSGKSTLMKYIYHNKQTEQHLNSSVSGKNVIRPSFFFHNRGSYYQKSLEGLLRSLLYQILSAERTIANAVVSKYSLRSLERRVQWSRQDLEESWIWIRDQTDVDLSICLFLDALDEYDGDPESVVYFLRFLVEIAQGSTTKIKICFSSRLYNVFIDEFRKCPGFKIHEHTKKDVEQVIAERMFKSPSIIETLASGDAHTEFLFRELKCELVRRAEGVFLWLKLALDNLLRSHREGESMSLLLDRLRSLPDELGQFYRRIIENVQLKYRWDTYVMLEAVLRFSGNLTAEELCGILACSSVKSLKDTLWELPYPQSEDFAESQFSRRLRSRCGGLLELVPKVPDYEGDRQHTVRLMHQTVKEFVSQPGFQQLVLSHMRDLPMENGHTFLSKYGLCRLYHAKYADKRGSVGDLDPFLDHTTFVEMTTGKSQKQLLDDMSSTGFPELESSLDLKIPDIVSVMVFAIQRNLRLYVSETLEMSGNHIVNMNPMRSLLHYAVDSTNHLHPSRNHFESRLDMVAILLKAGADTKAVYNNLTPWGLMFRNCLSYGYRDDLFRRTRYFLESGRQDPNEIIFTDKRNDSGCNAIHITSRHFDADLTQLLVESGAAVNPLNPMIQSPLDSLVDSFVTPREFDTYDLRRPDSDVERAYKTALHLLIRGGRCTSKSLICTHIRINDKFYWTGALECFINCIEYAGYDTGYDTTIMHRELLRLKKERDTTIMHRKSLRLKEERNNNNEREIEAKRRRRSG